MRRVPARAYVFVAVTCLVAAPFVALGIQDVLNDEPPGIVAFYIWALCVLLSLRPIRIAPTVELSASEVAVLAGVVLLTPGQLALVAAFARIVVDLATRKSPVRIIRNSAAQAISAGTAALVFQLILQSMADRIIGPIAEVIAAGALAALALVVLDLGQILALQLMLGTERLSGQTLGWINRTGRAQLLWGLAAVIAVEIILVQPWFLLPGIPLFLLGYLDIRARFIAERRARLLATLVEVGHAVGSSLDPNEVFRNVYRQVAAVMDADNFFVASIAPDGSTVQYRFLWTAVRSSRRSSGSATARSSARRSTAARCCFVTSSTTAGGLACRSSRHGARSRSTRSSWRRSDSAAWWSARSPHRAAGRARTTRAISSSSWRSRTKRRSRSSARISTTAPRRCRGDSSSCTAWASPSPRRPSSSMSPGSSPSRSSIFSSPRSARSTSTRAETRWTLLSRRASRPATSSRFPRTRRSSRACLSQGSRWRSPSARTRLSPRASFSSASATRRSSSIRCAPPTKPSACSSSRGESRTS